MAAELGSYKQAHTSSPPLTLGNSRVVEGPAPLKELGSRAQAMRGGIGSSEAPRHDCYPNHIAPAPHGPSCRVVSLLEGGPTSPFRAEPGQGPVGKDPATRRSPQASPNPRPGSRVGPRQGGVRRRRRRMQGGEGALRSEQQSIFSCSQPDCTTRGADTEALSAAWSANGSAVDAQGLLELQLPASAAPTELLFTESRYSRRLHMFSRKELYGLCTQYESERIFEMCRVISEGRLIQLSRLTEERGRETRWKRAHAGGWGEQRSETRRQKTHVRPGGNPSEQTEKTEQPGTAAQQNLFEAAMAPEAPYPFPTVDVPDHAHYTIGSVILAIGITGMIGNFLVIYAFCRKENKDDVDKVQVQVKILVQESQPCLWTPANMFIINLAITDLLMCVTQTPTFFTTSMHKRWIFGEKGCELYAFCGALFGICSMITLTVIAIDRYFVITRPLTSIGVLSRKRALLILVAAWAYSLGWSLPPFFGWSAYVPEGLMTSCTWDYMTFTPSVRAYTMLLFIFVFFLPLFIIIYCYVFIFRAIRNTNQAVGKINGSIHSHGSNRDSVKNFHRLQNEWKMAKIALIVILLYVISWSPCTTHRRTFTALRWMHSDWMFRSVSDFSSLCFTCCRYADMLTPYMNSVPAIIAKASAIHNPIIYAITHPKYRLALAKYIPYLGVLLCVHPRDLRSTSSSFMSTRRSTVTSQTSDISSQFRHQSNGKSRLSSVSDSESGLTDTEADLSSMSSRPASRQVSCDISRDTAELPDFKPSSSFKSKMKSHDSGIFEKTSYDTDVSMAGVGERGSIPNNADFAEGHVMRGTIGRIPSIVITSETSPFLPIGRKGSCSARSKTANNNTKAGSG
ncbi:hypothetical protein L3Q82_012133 [Scortum barcoo]|uniref:Uncharacterized protein n=1 Tax=Scortum barcoo TaxID=214431 RepID=A0ACB8W7X9_9TELE|nr:hypothetical protein L3Q82_012133 [Scortum barcoo]